MNPIWKQEILDRMEFIEKELERQGVTHRLMAMGGKGLLFEVSTSQNSYGELVKKFFSRWTDCLCANFDRTPDGTLTLTIVFDSPPWAFVNDES